MRLSYSIFLVFLVVVSFTYYGIITEGPSIGPQAERKHYLRDQMFTDAEPEIWAQLPPVLPRHKLPDDVLQASLHLCGRCLFRSLLDSTTVYQNGMFAFVSTGDIPDMWIRDSAVQVAVLLSRLANFPFLRVVIEGTIRQQAYFVVSDPYANSYRRTWVHPSKLSKFERQLGRGGWVATRNYEMDSGAYFFNLLWNYFCTDKVMAARLLQETLVYNAVHTMLAVWKTEISHELSTYRYSELPNDGLGSAVTHTGLGWSGFRPSDDPQKYGYNIPVNMYAAGSLRRLLRLDNFVWKSTLISTLCTDVLLEIENGLQKYSKIEYAAGHNIYAYEVDGLGGVLHSFDDPNIPSLLSLPLLGYPYDQATYLATRSVVLSTHNRFYFKGAQLTGLGSPHTPHKYVWSLSHIVQALTATNTSEVVVLFRDLLRMTGSNGLLHESNHVDNPTLITRPLFQWANSMFVVLFEQVTGVSCNQAAVAYFKDSVFNVESKDVKVPANGGRDLSSYYATLWGYVEHK